MMLVAASTLTTPAGEALVQPIAPLRTTPLMPKVEAKRGYEFLLRGSVPAAYSCPLLARQNILLGKVPTTPTIASIIGAMQSQEALKVINNMPIQPGHVTHFNGMVNDMHTTAYVPRDD